MKAIVMPVLLVLLFALLIVFISPIVYGLGWLAGSLISWLFLPASAEIAGLTIPQIVGIGAVIVMFAKGSSSDD